MITFEPLSGAARASSTAPLSYLLHIDDVCILLDCGSPDWSPEELQRPFLWESYCAALKNAAPNVDLVLLSHGDLAHCGLYAYAYSRWGLNAPTYATLPVQAMGRIATMEDIEGIRDEEDVGDVPHPQSSEQPPAEVNASEDIPEVSTTNPPESNGKFIATINEVQDAFDAINTLRYSQPTHLQGRCQGLTITPFSAGHTLGGTIWKIRSPSSGTFVYAVNMSHMRERHLDGTVLMRGSSGGIFESLARPDVLITDAERADVMTSRRKDRDAALIDTITTTLSSRSSVLMPCDASTRILELLVLLDQHWNYSKLKFPICLLSRSGEEMLTFVRSMMEWLGGTISKEDVGDDGHFKKQNKRKRDDGEDDPLGAIALRFRHLEFFPNPQALLQRYSSKDPKLILAVPATMSHGPSRHLFSDFAAVPDNVLLLTGRCEEGTLGRVLFERWNNSQRAEDRWDKGKIGNSVMLDGTLRLRINSKVPLQGTELDIYLEKERAAKEREAARVAAAQRNQQMLEADEGDSDSDTDEDEDDEDEAEVREVLGADAMDTSSGNTPRPAAKRRNTDKGMDVTDWGMDDEGSARQLISFDIYLKGNVSKATSFFKSAGQSQRFRMFPFIERKRRVDEYGETLDVGMWIRKGKVLEEDTESEDVKDFRRRKQLEEEAKAQQEPPSKYVSSEVEFQLACRLLYLDMEGLNDSRAVKTIVPQVNPRKMIIVRASLSATDALLESCGNIRLMTKDIFAPATGETVQIGQQINSFSISISDELLKSVKMSSFEDNEIGYVMGRIVVHSNSTIPTLEPALASSNPKTQTVLATTTTPKTLGSRPAVVLPQSTMIGELKLTALKARLAAVGIQAELVGEGVLICGSGSKNDDGTTSLDDSVAVKKTGKGQVELEGNVSSTYYTVRKEIYNLHALVATQA